MRKYSTVEVALIAVRQDGLALRDVPEELKTEAVCLEAVSQRGLSLEDVPVPMRTEEMCLAAVRQHAGAMQYVPVRHRDAVRDVLVKEAEVVAATTEQAEDGDADGPRP